MTDIFAGLTQRSIDIAAFISMITFSVVALELLRVGLTQRWPRVMRRANMLAALLALIFVAMAAYGLFALLNEGKSFLTLALLLTGVASIGVLGDLMWRFHTGRLTEDDELRRLEAMDL